MNFINRKMHGTIQTFSLCCSRKLRVHISDTSKIISENLIFCVLFPKSLDGQHCVKDITVLDNLHSDYFA